MIATSPCCSVAAHEALKRDRAAWEALPCIGYLTTPADDDGPATRLELRNHSCGSTLALEVPFESAITEPATASAA